MSKKKIALIVLAVLALLVGGLVIYGVRNMPGHTPPSETRMAEAKAYVESRATASADAMPEPIRPVAQQALQSIRAGIAYLIAYQEKDGHLVRGDFAPKPAYTALAIDAVVRSPDGYTIANTPFLQKALDAMVAAQKPDGGIYSEIPVMSFSNYATSLALIALQHADQEKYKDVISRATEYLKDGQYVADPDDPFFGSVGYQPGAKGDLNQTANMLEALEAAGVPKDDPAYKAAQQFITNTQNNSETNKQAWAADDGGFTYRPGNSPAGSTVDSDGTTRYSSYGTMSYAGLVSFLMANVEKDDQRVQSAFRWVREHYDLNQNVNMKDKGLFYYYRIMAKALQRYGQRIIVTPDGVQHDWAKELAQTLMALQRPDGSWVNDTTDYLEGDEVLVTAYALRTLSICYEVMRTPPPAPPAP